MKKSLIALAALAATASFAQSTVTLSGLLDMSYANIGGNVNTAKKGQTVTAINGSATSNITIAASEDLGGGMRSRAFFELDPRAFATDGGAIGRHQTFVELSGGFGAIKLGSPNSASLAAYGAGAPLGTATGSGYSATNATLGMTTRYNRSVRYDTPAVNGLSASVLFAPGNNADTGTAAYAGLPYQRSVTEFGVSYAKGPLVAVFSSLQAGSSNVVAAAAPTATATSKSTTFNTIGANYTMGATKLFAGYNSGKTLGTAASTSGPVEFAAQADGIKTKGYRVGASQSFGAITGIVSYAEQEIGNANDFVGSTTRKVTGLRLENALSKRTVAYVAYEDYNSGASSANKTNITAVGLRHSF